MKRAIHFLPFYLFTLLLCSCGTSLPENCTESKDLPRIYPDYIDVTIPVNMAPLTFELDEEADDMIARYAAGNEEIICEGKAQPDVDDWQQLISNALQTPNSNITVDVYARRSDQWTHYKPFSIYVSSDSIDSYLSYRLIFPSFVSYESLTINQRCLENYDESVIYDNVLCSFEKEGQCINCHHYQQYNPERMQFHARQNHGGTVIAYDGKIKKVNMRNDSILSAGVYPAWHPWLNLIVYSTNKTAQEFHTVDHNKIEVFDSQSDLIAYDVEKGEVTNLENDTTEFEVFPAWAPDGNTLYYCSAHFEKKDTTLSQSAEVVKRSKELKYNIYRKSFDPETMTFGPRELVFAADSLDKSATLPRISPDGRYLMFTLAAYGVFHIWHHDADLWLMDLQSGETRPAEEINSSDTESYHSWSSNGKWVVFSSRRDDGTYTRPFFAHISADGRFTKPFELPSADPDYHRQFMRCYNIPEFMHGPVTIKPQTFADVLKGEGEPVRYRLSFADHRQ
ncbi:MAG: PD40 domain-containing protein [Prevotella sp.]|nr:PD40 domain-containing protein [Prevotella sp.]